MPPPYISPHAGVYRNKDGQLGWPTAHDAKSRASAASLQSVYLLGNAHFLLYSDAGAPAPFSRSRSTGLAIFPTAFLGSVCSMKISRGIL